LFFSTYHGFQLWKSDGTAAGTQRVTDVSVNDRSYFFNVNGTLFFTAGSGSLDTELWKSDGTAAGTTLVTRTSGDVVGLGAFNQTLFFQVVYPGGWFFPDRFELWKSDGTAAGTTFVADLDVNSYLTDVNGKLYFAASDESHGSELWQSDGTAAG